MKKTCYPSSQSCNADDGYKARCQQDYSHYYTSYKQGQTVHKLQITTFWDIYIYTYRESERERDIINFFVFGLQGSEAYSLGQTDRQT